MDYLPKATDGYLPYWLLATAVIAALNTVQNFTTLKYFRELYAKTTVTNVQSRTFGIWTLTAASIRLTAAYDLHNPAVYRLAFASYIFALFHFASENVVFGTARVNRATISPLLIASGTALWMWNQWDHYVK